MNVKRVAMGMVSLMALAACHEPMAVEDAGAGLDEIPSRRAIDARRQLELPSGAVGISIQASGPLTPGEPIRIVATVEPLVDVANVVSSMRAPEIEFARVTGWDDNYRVPRGLEIPALTQAGSGPGPMRTPLVLTGEVIAEAPGAYEITVHVTSEPLVTSFRVNGTVQESLWLYVSEDGGSTSQEFDGSRVAEGHARVPGPARPASNLDVPPTIGSLATSSGLAKVNAYLYFTEESSTVDVYGSAVVLKEYDFPGGPLVNSEAAVTDANGLVTFTCSTAYRQLEVKLWGVEVIRPSTTITTVGCDDISPPTYSFNMGGMGRAFLNLEHDVVPTVDAAFADGQSTLTFVYQGGTGPCSYSPSHERIQLNSGCLFGTGGLATQAHEYGHAFQHRALGGSVSVTDCNPHTYSLLTNYKCAYVEGFAEYVALSAGYTGFSDSFFIDVHCLSYDPCSSTGDDPHLMVEGAVMAFLSDVTDINNSESYDNVTISQAYLADIIETCQVRKPSPIVWVKPDRIHWLIHCIQRSIDGYDGGGFPPSEEPSSYTVSSGHSVSATEVRRLWRWHFFNSTALYPISVSLSVQDTGQPFSWVTATAVVQNGVSPYTYSWKIDGSAACGNQSTCQGQLGSAGTFTEFRVTVTDATSDQDTAQKSVQAEWGGGGCPECPLVGPPSSNAPARGGTNR